MSNSKNAIQEIKSLMVKFGFLAEEVTYQDFKLEDTTIVQFQKLEVGEEMFRIDDSFERVALEDGVYSVFDFEVEVSEGKISNVKEVFVDATLKDGTQVSATGKGFEVGAKVYVVKEGVSEMAPDGTHELSDGTCITVKDGEIVTVESPAEEEKGPGEEPGMESPADEGAEAISPVEKETAPNPQHMDEMYSMLKEFVTKCSEKMAEMEGQYSSLLNEFEAFKKEPAGKKITYSKTESFSSAEGDVDNKVANILALRKNNKI